MGPTLVCLKFVEGTYQEGDLCLVAYIFISMPTKYFNLQHNLGPTKKSMDTSRTWSYHNIVPYKAFQFFLKNLFRYVWVVNLIVCPNFYPRIIVEGPHSRRGIYLNALIFYKWAQLSINRE